MKRATIMVYFTLEIFFMRDDIFTWEYFFRKVSRLLKKTRLRFTLQFYYEHFHMVNSFSYTVYHRFRIRKSRSSSTKLKHGCLYIIFFNLQVFDVAGFIGESALLLSFVKKKVIKIETLNLSLKVLNLTKL